MQTLMRLLKNTNMELTSALDYTMITPIQKNVGNELLKIGAVQIRVQNPYTWVSGIESPIYCDNRKVNSHVESRGVVLKAFCDLINEKYPDVDIIAGVATGGMPLGVLIADRLEKPFVYVRQAPKMHGLKQQIEGVYEAGQKVLLIEDHISTGGSSLKAIKAIKVANLELLCLLSIMTYGFDSAKEAFESNGTCHESLCNLDVIVKLAHDREEITTEEKESVLRFQSDPNNWL